MATYVGVTDWIQAAQGTNTGGNQWLGASARIVKDSDASTDTSFVLYAEYMFYLWYRVDDSDPYNIYKFVTGIDSGSMFSDTTTPNRRESIQINGTQGRYGTVRRVSMGTFGNNVNVSTNAFRTGVALGSGQVTSNAAIASWTTPAAPSGSTDYVNKVVVGTEVLIDISNDTVTPEKMLSGITAHDQDGAPISGSIATKTSNDITRSGATITVPAGYYESPGATYTVPSGSAVTPTGQTITGTTSLAFNSTSGKVEASFTGSKTITPNVTAGYVTTGTGNTVNASGSVSKTPVQLDSNIIAANIRSKTESGTAVSILGITGTFTSDATAAAGDILNGRTAYKDGKKITGTMANHNNTNVTITNVAGTALSGYYGGTSKAVIDSESASKLTPENIAEGITILGVTGTLSADDMISIQDTKTVNSSFTQKTYTADAGYNYLANVVVRPINVTRAITGTTNGYTVTIAEYSES